MNINCTYSLQLRRVILGVGERLEELSSCRRQKPLVSFVLSPVPLGDSLREPCALRQRRPGLHETGRA